MKRAFDFVVSAVGLLLLLPLMLAIAFLIKIDSPGPLMFRQERVGLGGRLFRIHKFRTMVVDAPRIGPAVTAGDDQRVTRVGRWLRQYKLDELPQLLDVLRGDMSLVGPRPEVPEFVALYPSAVRDEILSVRPGITDETSLRFRNEAELLRDAVDPRSAYINTILPQKLASYVNYVRSRSFCGDVRILLLTVRRVWRQ